MYYHQNVISNCLDFVTFSVIFPSVTLFFCVLCMLQGVGSAINKLNDVIAMIAEVRSIANSLEVCSDRSNLADMKHLKL